MPDPRTAPGGWTAADPRAAVTSLIAAAVTVPPPLSAEDQCHAEEKESFLTPFLPPSTDVPSKSGGVPGVVAVAGTGPDVLGEWVAGQACVAPPAVMAAETVFDLASLTKVVATTTVTLALLGGELDSPVARYLPSVTAPVTVRQLLTHTSGLPASVTFYW